MNIHTKLLVLAIFPTLKSCTFNDEFEDYL